MWTIQLLVYGLALPSRHTLDRRSALAAGAALAATPWRVAAAEAGRIPTWTLAGGVAMPTLAINTAGMSAEAAERATRLAFAAGVTHVDFHPGMERDGVARAIASSPASFFLTTKIRAVRDPAVTPSQAADLARRQIKDDLRALGVARTDMLMLRDCPDCAVMQAQVMVSLQPFYRLPYLTWLYRLEAVHLVDLMRRPDSSSPCCRSAQRAVRKVARIAITAATEAPTVFRMTPCCSSRNPHLGSAAQPGPELHAAPACAGARRTASAPCVRVSLAVSVAACSAYRTASRA